MRKSKEQVAEEIIDLFLSLPWAEREEVIGAVKHNDYFCFYCGVGSEEYPNPGCQCWNDE